MSNEDFVNFFYYLLNIVSYKFYFFWNCNQILVQTTLSFFILHKYNFKKIKNKIVQK